MPLPISHGLLGASIVAAIHPHPTRRYCLPLLAGAVLANCADLDFILVSVLGSKSWHRTFSHSLGFAVIVALVIFLIMGASRVREATAYSLAFMSHGILDYLTTKHGGGVQLLWPFSLERMKLGMLGLSEVPSRLPLPEVLRALLIEFMIFAPLFAAALFIRLYVSRRGPSRNRPFLGPRTSRSA
jgi:membrane-bound metal-dependent hydrolase YbcI (DUF457 family)